ncbi:MAG: hypothetical protein JW832_16295 [Deltaproteobacteria bacterium]|nr:hypothetical protein [Deltaproteobacteria bacterium]
MATGGVKKKCILCLHLCWPAFWTAGCDRPVCTNQYLQGEIYGQPWALQSGLAIRGRSGFVIILSGEEPAGNPCSFSSYTTGGPTLQITVPALPCAYPLNGPFDATQVSFCAADALVCDIAVSGEIRIDRADLSVGTLSGRIQAYLDDAPLVSGCFTIRRCRFLEWLLAGPGSYGLAALPPEEQDR